MPGAFGAEDAGAGATIAPCLEEGGMGKWVISATLLGILAVAFWASYGLWIRVVASVPAWVWLLLAIGGGLSIVPAPDSWRSSSHNCMGFDEPPVIVEPGNESRHYRDTRC